MVLAATGAAARGASAGMTPPRWVDEDGQACPTRPCPQQCGRVIPIKRWPVLRTGAIRHRPYEVLSVVEWCGHMQEQILVPDGAKWFREIPVPGVAR
jgi:hypothetical protein